MKKSKIKILTALFAAALQMFMAFALAVPSSATAPAPAIEHAQVAYVECLETGDALLMHNPEKEIFTTSSTKLMTAIVAIEALSDRLDEKVVITSEMLAEVAGNRLGLSVGEEVTVNDLIHILVTGGNNDGAYCLAYLVAGSTAAFVEKMNEKAASLGAFNTHYTNPTGMHSDLMVTTVTDTAVIAKYAWSLPLFKEASSAPKYVMEATNKNEYRNIYNRNCLISKYYNSQYYNSNCKGLNAGSTEQGGNCVITVAENESLSYLIIVMGAEATEDTVYSYYNAQNLIDWAFDSFAMVDVLYEEQMLYEIPVTLSSAVDFVTLAPAKTVSVFLPTDVDIENEIQYSWVPYEQELQAPVSAGEVAGQISAVYNGETIGACDLVVTSDVERSDFLYTLNRIEKLTTSKGFIAAVVSAVIISVGVIFFNAYRRKNTGIY